jgi:hypothetical protein
MRRGGDRGFAKYVLTIRLQPNAANQFLTIRSRGTRIRHQNSKGTTANPQKGPLDIERDQYPVHA